MHYRMMAEAQLVQQRRTISEQESLLAELLIYKATLLMLPLVKYCRPLLVLVSTIVYEHYLGLSMQVLISISIGQSLLGIWEMVNLLQLIRYMTLFTLFYPKILILTLSYIGIVNFDNSFFSYLFQLHFNKNKLNYLKATDYRYYYQNISSKAIIINWGDMFVYIFLLLSFLFWIYLLSRFVKPKRDLSKYSILKKLYWKWINYLCHENSQFISNLIRLGMEIYIDWLFWSLYNLANFGSKNDVDVYSSTVSIICFIWMIGFTATIFYIIIFVKRDLRKEMVEHSRLKVLYVNINSKSKLSIAVHIVFITLRMLLAIINASLQHHGWAQLVLFVLLLIWVVAYHILIKPYDSVLKNVIGTLSYMFVLTLGLLYFSFINSPTELVRSGKGYILGIICIVIIFATILQFYVFAAIAFFISRKNKRKVKSASNNVKEKVPANGATTQSKPKVVILIILNLEKFEIIYDQDVKCDMKLLL